MCAFQQGGGRRWTLHGHLLASLLVTLAIKGVGALLDGETTDVFDHLSTCCLQGYAISAVAMCNVVRSRWLVTAASATWNETSNDGIDPLDLQMCIGGKVCSTLHDIKEYPKAQTTCYPLQNFYRHSDWEPGKAAHDIALVQTMTMQVDMIVFHAVRVFPERRMWLSSRIPEDCYLYSYGPDDNCDTSDRRCLISTAGPFLRLKFEMQDPGVCVSKHSGHNLDADKIFCSKNEEGSICEIDWGAPLECGGFIEGIASRVKDGNSFCNKGPDVVLRYSRYIQWLDMTILQNSALSLRPVSAVPLLLAALVALGRYQ